MNSFWTKSVLITILIGLLLSPLDIIFTTKKAEAILGVADVTFVEVFLVSDPVMIGFMSSLTGISASQAASNAITAGSTGSSLVKTIADYALKISGQLLKTLILDRLVDALIAWIQRGGEGAIIDDWTQFGRDAWSGAVGIAAQEIGLADLCDPFKFQINLLFQQPGKFSKDITCTFDKIKANLNQFEDDFTQGKWIAYNELLAPQNNFYGNTLIGWNEAIERGKKGEDAAKSEGIAGRGFLSFKGSDGKIITPGSFASDITEAALIDIPTNSILNADDIAAYVSAIANAAINTFAKKGLEDMLGTRKQSRPNYNADPCANLTGNDLGACLGYKEANKNVYKSNTQIYLSKINESLNPKRQTITLLNQSIDKQNSLTRKLKALADCNNLQTTRDELITASTTLDSIQVKKQPLENEISILTDAYNVLNNVTQNDFSDLSSKFNEIDPLLNSQKAINELSTTQSEFSTISSNVDVRLSTLINELNTCLGTTTASSI